MKPVWILLGVAAIFIIWVVSMYNGLIKLKVRCEEAWADIDVQLKRRYNLIPNLVNTVKGYASHESQIFQKVTEARSAAMGAKDVADKVHKENILSDALKSLFAVSENYPTLRASENFLELQKELTDAEDKIAYSRRFYNGNVRDYNIRIQVFPSNIVAGIFRFSKKELFEAESQDRQLPEVKF